MNPLTPKRIGDAAEVRARRYLEQQGLQYVTHHYQCRLGEIDLIMTDQDNMVFVEVRYRQKTHFSHPVETIDRRKQKKIIKTAQFYLQWRRLYEKIPCRFDVVCLTGDQANSIEWIQHAFETD